MKFKTSMEHPWKNTKYYCNPKKFNVYSNKFSLNLFSPTFYYILANVYASPVSIHGARTQRVVFRN